VLVLVNDPSDVKHPRITELLLGLQHYLLYPEAAEDLPAAAQSLLWTASLADGVSEQPGEPGWIPALRESREVQERQELIGALRATKHHAGRRDARDLARGAPVPDEEAWGPAGQEGRAGAPMTGFGAGMLRQKLL
jgi:hypothetical protein